MSAWSTGSKFPTTCYGIATGSARHSQHRPNLLLTSNPTLEQLRRSISARPRAILRQVFFPYMTARQARKERRAAERHAAKEARRAESAASAVPERVNRSTGPVTPQGKNTSRWNSFKHGLARAGPAGRRSGPARCSACQPARRTSPATETEEILVNEIAENFWRLRRMRELETRGMQPENVLDWLDRGLLALIARTMASAERALHKAVTALRRLQLDRGFVPSKCQPPAEPAPEFVPQNHPEAGFVPSFLEEHPGEPLPSMPHQHPFSPPIHQSAA